MQMFLRALHPMLARGMTRSNKLDKALILLLRATQPGELQAAQATVLRLAENQGLDAHDLVEHLMKGGGDKKYSDTEMLEIKKQAIQQGRDLEKMARGVDPDEVDWYARAQKMLANLHRFEPKHHEFIQNMAERLSWRSFDSLTDKQRKYFRDLWLRARRW
jgi:hypothetical protein